jgi:hypothetical protein
MRSRDVSISARVDAAVLATSAVRVEISMRPFSFTIRRHGRSLLRSS